MNMTRDVWPLPYITEKEKVSPFITGLLKEKKIIKLV